MSFRARGSENVHLLAKVGEFARKLVRSARCLAAPERNVGRRAVRVFDQQPPVRAFDAPDSPRRAAEQKNIAREALDREIFVHRADRSAVGHRDNRINSRLGNGAAVRDGRKPCAAAPAQSPIHSIVVKQRPIAPPARRNALRQHFNNPVEFRARQFPIR